jgi:hypothetical protein
VDPTNMEDTFRICPDPHGVQARAGCQNHP